MPNMIPDVLAQHLEMALHLAAVRRPLLAAPHVALRHLARADERLAAHLDGLNVAGRSAARAVDRCLEETSPEALFVACVYALSEQGGPRLERLLALCAAQPQWLPGVTMALGWVEARQLQGLAAHWLDSSSATERLVGLAACAWHRVDPGPRLVRGLEDADETVRARALRTAGELGLRPLESACRTQAEDSNTPCAFWGAWSAVLLGDRHAALARLASVAAVPGPFQARALSLAIQAKSVPAAHELLRSSLADPGEIRSLIRGAALTGDPVYIDWLIELMGEDSLARVAGESFSLITGADLALLDLERRPPASLEPGPNDDPEDANVAMDEDEGLPWPDPERVPGWWKNNSQRFQAGVRYFMGAALDRENCQRVLREGYQRQRIAAALYLSLLNPGAPLFEWRAPARRQQRLLAQSQ